VTKFQYKCSDKESWGNRSHERIRKEFIEHTAHLNEKIQVFSKQDFINLETDINSLRTNRVKLDYNHSQECTESISKDSLDLATKITGIIQKLTNHGQYSSR
jgi:hypothetical protein